MTILNIFFIALALYLAAGALFALAFVTAGAGRIDPAARGAGIGFRLAILPGSAVLWPLLARRWVRACKGDGKP